MFKVINLLASNRNNNSKTRETTLVPQLCLQQNAFQKLLFLLGLVLLWEFKCHNIVYATLSKIIVRIRIACMNYVQQRSRHLWWPKTYVVFHQFQTNRLNLKQQCIQFRALKLKIQRSCGRKWCLTEVAAAYLHSDLRYNLQAGLFSLK